MRIATWNLEWATPRSARGQALRHHLEGVGADVVVTTEDHSSAWDRYPHVIDAGNDWGYTGDVSRRKVIAWSVAPWTDVRTAEHGAARGRLVVADTAVGSVEATVVAVCIPWAAAHVSTGRRDRQRWAEHLEFCAVLTDLLASLPGTVVVAGDFNQAVPRRRQPQPVYDALTQALDGYEVVTAGTTAAGPLIDHIAVGPGLTTTAVRAWPNTIDGARLSDHAGVGATIEPRHP